MLTISNKNMTRKQYQWVKITLVVILAAVFSQSIIYGNYLIPIAVLIIITLVLLYLRRQLKEVIADERDYQTAGKAAGLSIQIYAWVTVIAMLILYSQKDLNPAYEIIAMVLAYSTCFLMLLYAFIFRYYNKISLSDKKSIYIFVGVLFFIILTIFGLRLFSGEDDWLCKDGQWIKHGKPSFPAPTKECK